MKHILTVFSLVFLLLGGYTVKSQVLGTAFHDFNSNGTKNNNATSDKAGLKSTRIAAYNASRASIATTTNDTYAKASSSVMRSMLNGYSALNGINTNNYANANTIADCPAVTNDGQCSNNTLDNSTLEVGNYTPTGTFVGSPYMLISNNGSSISNWWVNKGRWVDVQNTGGGPDGSCRVVWVDPTYGNSVCLYPIPTINLGTDQCYTMSVWAASFDPNNPTAAQTMSFDIVTDAGNEQYIVVDDNGGGTVNSFVDGPYGVVQIVKTLQGNSNPLDMSGSPFTDANTQTLDWGTLNWQLVTIKFHATQAITITPNYSINGSTSNGVAFDNPVFGNCCAVACPDPRTDEIICKGLPSTNGFSYVLNTTLTNGTWTVSPALPSIYIDQDPLDPTYLTTASGLPGGNTYTFTYDDGTCQDIITLTISDQSYTCASGIVVDTISVTSTTTVSDGTVSTNAATYDAASILGGEVDVKVEELNPPASFESHFAFYDQYNIAEWINGSGDFSMATITWDGNDNDANTLNATGLGGVDLTSSGNFGFNVSADISKYKITLRVYTDAVNYSESVFTMNSSQTHLYNVPVEFTSFTAVGGSGADMSNVGAVQLIFEPLNLLNESNGIDLGIECFHTPCVIMPACTLTVDSAVPSTCDPNTNNYSLDVSVSYSNQPTGDITINIGGTDYTFTPDGTSPDTYTVTGLTSDGTAGIDVSATFVGDAACTHTLVDAYNAPASCGCDNVTDPGTITGEQSFCGDSYDPSPITNVTLPTGGTGTMEYMWISASYPAPTGSPDWSSIPNTNTDSYDPGVLTQTTCFRRCARRVGCTSWAGETEVVCITLYPTVSVTCDKTDVTTNGGSDGTASVVATGGTSPYTYLWNSNETTASINSKTSGTYTVTVTDANGCTALCNSTINEPGCNLSATADGTNVLCNGGTDGTATATASGNIAAVTYAWSSGGTTATISNLAADTYSVTISETASCTAVASYTVTEPPVMDITCDKTDVTTNGGSDGTATVSATGGTSPYTYLWDSGETTATISGKTSGTYTVTVTDANGCTDVCNSTINEPGCNLSATADGTNVLCNGGSDGTATATASGNIAAVTYLWSNGETTATINNLAADTYTVTISETASCMAVASYTVTEPPVMDITCDKTDVTTNGGSDGTATVSATGGTSPYTYLWDSGETTASISGKTSGTYTVTVTDAIGCPEFSEAAVVAIDAPKVMPLLDNTDTVGFAIEQTYSSEGWPTPCNYNYLQRFEFYKNGNFRPIIASLGRGCGNNGTYRPVTRIAWAGTNNSFFEWNNTKWQNWQQEKWTQQTELTTLTPENYWAKIANANNQGFYLMANNGQLDQYSRGDQAFLYVTKHHPSKDEGDGDLPTIGPCCNTDYQQGPEKFIDPTPEPILDTELVTWYVAQLKNDDTPGKEYCWAESVVENGIYVAKTYPCYSGPMFVPIQ